MAQTTSQSVPARASGILLHPTSLPGPHGLGELGPAARRFADFLRAAGQSWWQVLPLGPTSYGDSPYQSLSTFAGNPLLIGFEQLVRDGLLRPGELADFPDFDPQRIDYGTVIPARQALLAKICRAFPRRAAPDLRARHAAFCEKHRHWLDDYALFQALKTAHGGRAWLEWDEPLRRREPNALRAARRTLAPALRHIRLQQFLFDDQWQRLRAACRRRGIQLIGDIPIFVAHDSADVWAHPHLFHLEPDGRLRVQAGVPPDYFSATGQLWGNPLYNWDVMRADDFAWWTARLQRVYDWVDLVRIDHFRGFAAYWEVPGDAATARHGHWVPGPGAELFDTLRAKLGPTPIIAEDLGVITPDVEALRDQFHFPGLVVLQFCLAECTLDPGAPFVCPENRVIYPGTHDNDTAQGWFNEPPDSADTRPPEQREAEQRHIRNYLQTDGQHIHWDLISLAAHSPARLAIFPMQDVLGLGRAARMNRPGQPQGNWQWRLSPAQLRDAPAERLHNITTAAKRCTPPTA
ncbi:MAG: 4-alpha-glucanotransferase [Candidatus Marinimicrobia bacterium]|nr:4-alpha-glucanotransferase [Candidatus Neomarinimicrobiota bacterium]